MTGASRIEHKLWRDNRGPQASPTDSHLSERTGSQCAASFMRRLGGRWSSGLLQGSPSVEACAKDDSPERTANRAHQVAPPARRNAARGLAQARCESTDGLPQQHADDRPDQRASARASAVGHLQGSQAADGQRTRTVVERARAEPAGIQAQSQAGCWRNQRREQTTTDDRAVAETGTDQGAAVERLSDGRELCAHRRHGE